MLRGTREGSIARRSRLVLTALVMLVAAAFTGQAAFAAADGMNALSAKDMRTLSAFKQADTPKKLAKTKKRSAKKAHIAAKTKARKSRKATGTKLAHKKSRHAKTHRIASSKTTGRRSRVKSGGGGVAWNASSGCVPGQLKSVLHQVSQRYGSVVVNSTSRGRRHNRAVGGVRNSYHLRCMAVDFRVHGSTKGLWAFLRNNPNVGGLHRYPSGFFHIDAGPKRTW